MNSLGFSGWSSLFSLLLLVPVLSPQGGRARDLAQEPLTKDKEDHSDVVHHHHHQGMHLGLHHMQTHASPSSSDHQTDGEDHMDPQLIVFFVLKDLKVGNMRPIFFPHRDLSSPRLLSRQEADSIPFSLKELPDLLHSFSFSQGSPQAIAMRETLELCEAKPIPGETKLCATSLESMLDFSRKIIGSDTEMQVLSTVHAKKSSTLLQKYKVLAISLDVPAPKTVSCHALPYAYAVFYCHIQGIHTRIVKVLLEGENGDMVEAVAVCHMDTTEWDSTHVAFRVLGTKPGTSSVCHFLPADNLVWIPSPSSV